MKKQKLLFLFSLIFIFSMIHMSFASQEENIISKYELRNVEVLSDTEEDGDMYCWGTGSVECNGEKIYKVKITL